MTTATTMKPPVIKDLRVAGDTKRLLTHLGRGGAKALYWTDNGRRSLWSDTDKRPPIPADWTNQNVYFGVHPCTDIPPTNSRGETVGQMFVRSQVDYLAAVNCFFAEFDAKDFSEYYRTQMEAGRKGDDLTFDEWKIVLSEGKPAILAHLDTFPHDKGWLYPSVIVDSGGGYHCYWLLEETVMLSDENREHMKRVQAAWVLLVGGDEDAKDLARMLRIPGTRNVKKKYGPDFPTVSIIEADFRRLFTLSDVEALTEHIWKEQKPAPTHTNSNGNGHYTFTDDLTKAAANLKRLHPCRADDYQEWVNAGMALSGLGDAGLRLWDDWSRQSSKYAEGVCSAKWKTFTSGGGLTLASLAYWASEDDPTARTAHSNGDGSGNVKGLGVDTTVLDGLLQGLNATDDEPSAKMLFAWENVSTLATLDDETKKRFLKELHIQGVKNRWIFHKLDPEIEATKQRLLEETERARGNWEDIISCAHRLGYSFRLNELSDSMEVNTDNRWERMSDVHEARLLSLLHANGLKHVDVARRAFLTAAGLERYHPVKVYLQRLKWDGKDHIGKLAGYFHDAHDPIVYADGTRRTVFHAFFRRWLVGAVGKVYNPTECQNPMLILAGGQGKGKSYFAKWLCPLNGLHFEGAIKPEDKDYLGYLTTRWIWEVSELGATMRKADREALKAFITQQDATYRPAYGHHPLVKPALASFIGTVNPEGALLADPTGNRRFWPVELQEDGGIDWNYSQDVDVNQVWAQAYALYQKGEPWRLTAEERSIHENIVEQYEVEDVLAGYVQQYFTVDPGNQSLYTHTIDIIDTLRTYGGAQGTNRAISMQLSGTLTRLGLVRLKQDNRRGYMGIAKKLF